MFSRARNAPPSSSCDHPGNLQILHLNKPWLPGPQPHILHSEPLVLRCRLGRRTLTTRWNSLIHPAGWSVSPQSACGTEGEREEIGLNT